MANSIPALQNDPKARRYLVAQRCLYSRGKWVAATQLFLVVLLPLALVVVQTFWPVIKAVVATLALTIAVLDVALLIALKKSFQKRAAAVQELFDCFVFGLDWPELKAEKPDLEDVEGLSRGQASDQLRDWYPSTVGALKTHAAVAICQRSNCRWDSELRRYFRASLLAFASLLILAAIFIALTRNLPFHDLVLTLLAPILPVVLWAFREANEQRESAERADRLKRFGDQFWARILDGSLSAQESLAQSRAFQDAILEHRQRSPLVFDWFYKLLRGSFQTKMTYSAEGMVEVATQKGLVA